MTANGLIQLQPLLTGTAAARALVAPAPVKVADQDAVKSVLDLPDDVDVMEGASSSSPC